MLLAEAWKISQSSIFGRYTIIKIYTGPKRVKTQSYIGELIQSVHRSHPPPNEAPEQKPELQPRPLQLHPAGPRSRTYTRIRARTHGGDTAQVGWLLLLVRNPPPCWRVRTILCFVFNMPGFHFFFPLLLYQVSSCFSLDFWCDWYSECI